MPLIHVTHRNNWGGICESGLLVPRSKLAGASQHGRDSRKVSAFYLPLPYSIELLVQLRRAVAHAKLSTLPKGVSGLESDYVVLSIDESCGNIHWAPHPNEHIELTGGNHFLNAEAEAQIRGYKKTKSSVPISCISLIEI